MFDANIVSNISLFLLQISRMFSLQLCHCYFCYYYCNFFCLLSFLSALVEIRMFASLACGADQQERLKLIHDKFKEEVNQHLSDCRSILEELEAYNMELKEGMDRQSMWTFTVLSDYITHAYLQSFSNYHQTIRSCLVMF